jgi:hypothetical protein
MHGIWQEEDLKLVLNTTNAATANLINTPAYFQCTGYDAAGNARTIRCTARNASACVPTSTSGVVGCTLHYKDINVTTHLKPGKVARLCNKAWEDYAVFDKVAYVNGSVLAQHLSTTDYSGIVIPEAEAHALTQVLQAVDPRFNMTWALNEGALTHWVQNIRAQTSAGFGLALEWHCPAPALVLADVRCNVQYLSVRVTPSPKEPQPHHHMPALTPQLTAALANLPQLNELILTTVGNGSLLPQLGSLTSLKLIEIKHY